MRKIISTAALVIGVVCLIIGIGHMTWWSPQVRLSAEIPDNTPDAPITMISSEIHLAPDSNPEVKLGEEGKFTVAVARPWDIQEWAGSSAMNVIESVDTGSRTFKVEHKKGDAKAPNPQGSDLWISESEQEGRWDVAWPEEIHGPVALLVIKDGTEPAPKDLVVTWDNPEADMSAKWAKATPWFVAAVILFGLALILAMSRPKRRGGRRVADSPRRAAADRRGEDADRRANHTGRAAGAGIGAGVGAGAAAGHPDGQPGADAGYDGDSFEGAGDTAEYELPNFGGSDPYVPQSDDTIVASRRHGVVAPADSEEHDGNDQDRRDDDDDYYDGGPAAPAHGEQSWGDDERNWQEGDDVNPEEDPRFRSVAEPATTKSLGQREGRRSRAWKGLIAVGAALGLALPSQVAWADTSAEKSEEATAKAEEEEAYSILVTTQLERIMSDVSDVAAEGDKKRDAKKLESRFEADALNLRQDLYSALKKKVRLNDNLVPPISKKVVTAAVPVDRGFPRTVMAVTTGSNKDLPVIVTLKQANARSQYKVVSAVPMVEGATFPGIAVGDPEVRAVSGGGKKGGPMSPEDALKQFSSALGDAKSGAAKKFAKSPMVDQLRKANSETKKSYEGDGKGKFTTDYKVNAKSANALKMPDGSVMVSGLVTETMRMTPEKDGGKTKLAGFIREFVGKEETDKPVEARLTIPVVINIKDGKPAEVVGMSYVPVGVELK